MRHRPLLMLLSLLSVLAFGAAPAHAQWVGLQGLQSAGWVREYAVALPTLTVYAATEGNGVYKSVGGVVWEPFNAGLKDVPGAMNVRTVFTSGTDVYAGTSVGLFKSAGGQGAFQPVAQGPEEDPQNPKKLNQAVQAVFTGLVPGQMLAGVASGGVYKSTDGGLTWKPPAPGNGMPRAESVWSLGSYKDGLIYAATGSGIYVSTDFGSTWTLMSDGISGVTLRTFADDKWPNIYYASGTSGVFRTINGGLTWANIAGPPGKQLGGGQVRALTQVSGVNEKRIYAGTENGMYAGRTGIGAAPGQVTWRKVENTGLGANTIFWALVSPIPGTFVAGTQSNGGYAMTFVPPYQIAGEPNNKPTLNTLSPKRGDTLEVVFNGKWHGTETIEFEYQWQDCTTTCADIDDATSKTFVVPAQGKKYRATVIAKNDFPQPVDITKAKAYTDVTNASAANPADLPGEAQQSKALVRQATDPGGDGFPQPGDKLEAYDYKLSLATSFSFQWMRCPLIGSNCTPIPGATSVQYTLTDEDVTLRLCAKVTGRNAAGATTLDCGGYSNEIFPRSPKATGPTTLTGSAYVGDTLVSGVGTWEWAGTQFARQWEACEPDGGSCATISGAKSAAYVITANELGKRLRVRITVDSNGPNKKPDPIEVFTPVSDIVTPPPPPPANPQPQPQGNDQTPGGGTPLPPADKTAPAIGGASVGKNAQLKLTLSEPAKLTIVVQRAKPGRLKGKKCKAGGKQGKKCTVLTTVATKTVTAAAGPRTIALTRKKLAKGDYRAVITAVDSAGNRSTRTVSFKVKK